MPRQRVRLRSSALALVGRTLTALVGLALVFYGGMLVALALKADPGTVEQLSGYRTVFDQLASLTPGDADSRTRMIAGPSGLVAFLLLGWLATKELPRPYLARSPLLLEEADSGQTTLAPRAVERIGEIAATSVDAVDAARGRIDGDRLTVALSLRRAASGPETLIAVRDSVRAALAAHDLAPRPVTVTLAGFNRHHRRELR
ncbi:hypothetical protein DSM112329_00313 [Paraconexibacter sp. AEG42_29]|uniref:Alkaline shock response membrane anchor protein AmaP n=1 Tax=Paraconexibacter sp. AEG42_29 TaxID=2997339 RepID=A0AAU7APC4_9ACTN